MTTADRVDVPGYSGWATVTMPAIDDRVGKHRSVVRAVLTMHRLFYRARHRS